MRQLVPHNIGGNHSRYVIRQLVLHNIVRLDLFSSSSPPLAPLSSSPPLARHFCTPLAPLMASRLTVSLGRYTAGYALCWYTLLVTPCIGRRSAGYVLCR